MNHLIFNDICFCYPGNSGVHNLHATIESGQLVGVIGANGSGKSTMLRLAAGRIQPESGTIVLDGKSINQWSGKERAQRISYLPQAIEAGLPFTVSELVRLGRGADQQQLLFTEEELFNILGLLPYRETPINQLSGGERRRAYIAMVLAQGAHTILLDEPLAGLDLRYQYELLDLLATLCHTHNLTILISLHDLILTHGFDRILVLKDGRITVDAPPKEALTETTIRDTFDLAKRFRLLAF